MAISRCYSSNRSKNDSAVILSSLIVSLLRVAYNINPTMFYKKLDLCQKAITFARQNDDFHLNALYLYYKYLKITTT